MDENRIRQLLLTNIDSGEKYASISISNNLICSSGNSDQDMSDIAIEFYKVLYGEDMEISNKMGSLFAGDTMNSYNTVIKGASDIIKKFWNDHYHCLANFWVLPTQVGRSCRKCNKAADGDYMDKFLRKYLHDENFYGQFKENYDRYTRRFPRESFAELHMIEGIYTEKQIIVKDLPHDQGADAVINEMWSRIEKRAELIAKNKKNELKMLFLKILKMNDSII